MPKAEQRATGAVWQIICMLNALWIAGEFIIFQQQLKTANEGEL